MPSRMILENVRNKTKRTTLMQVPKSATPGTTKKGVLEAKAGHTATYQSTKKTDYKKTSGG